MMIRRSFLLIVLMLSTAVMLKAQYPLTRNIPVSDFEGGLQTWSIDQDGDSRMYFGNNQALIIYDGNDWEHYFVDNYTTVRAVMCDDRSGRIYVGASNELGYFEPDQQQHKLAYRSLLSRLPKEHRTFGEVWNIFRRGNDIVFQSKSSLMVLPNNDNGMMTVYDDEERIEVATHIHGKTLTAGKNGIGILHIDGGILPLKGTELMAGKVVRAILPYGRLILFVTNDAGIYAYDGTTTTPYITAVTPYLQEKQVFCAAISGDNMAVGTVRGGLVLYNLRTGETLYSNAMTGMQNNTVLSLMFDNNGNIWTGLDNGLCYVMKEASFNTPFGTNTQIGTGYTACAFNGNLYMGTNQGLFFSALPLPATPIPTQPQLLSNMTGQVWTLDTIHGQLLCGTDQGAFVVRGTTSQKIPGVDGTWKFVELPGHPGKVLACDYRGLLILNHTGSALTLANRITGTDIVSGNILADRDGSIWISHWQKGVYHLWLDKELTAVARQEYFHKDKGLLMDEGNLLCRIGGEIYISCVDGLYHYDKTTRTLVPDKQKSKIFSEYGVPLLITEAPNHDLWAYKPGYLAHAVWQKNGTYQLQKQPYSEACSELNVGKGLAHFMDNQQIVCSGNNGFFILNSRYKDDSKPTHTIIRRVLSTNNGDSLLYSDIADRQPAPHVVTIPHTLNSIRIEFVQPEYREQDAVTYSCWLEGYDNTWSSQQTKHTKEYTRLGKGEYTFHVRAVNQISGTTDEATLKVRILPAWWETWWAYAIYLLLTAVAVRYAAAYVRRQTLRRERKLKIEKERQLREQQVRFSLEQSQREKELMELKNQQMQYDVKHKSSELADSTMNLVRKNDLLQLLDEDIRALSESVRREDPKLRILKQIGEIRRNIQSNLNDDDNWNKFEENFNLVYDHFMQELIARFPDLKKNDRKLCAYLRMGLSSKEMASLLNTSVRSIETARYRLRKKLNLGNGTNLTDFIQKLGGE